MVPSPAELTYFLEIANVGNFSKAANKLGVSQPSLSLAIKRLEESVGVMLFTRHKQGVTLTKAGKKLQAQVKPLLQLWDNTRMDAVRSHAEIQGEINLGCHSTVGLFLHQFMADLLERCNNLSFHLKHDISQKTTENVINSTLDIGLVANPIKHPDLIMRKLSTAETTFWTGAGSRETQNIHSDNLVLICDPNIPQSQLLLKKWKHINFKSTRILTCNSLEVVANLTANGCGIGILPSCFTETIYPKKLQKIPGMPSCFDDLYLIYRKENRGVKAIEEIITSIKQYCAK